MGEAGPGLAGLGVARFHALGEYASAWIAKVGSGRVRLGAAVCGKFGLGKDFTF